MAYQAGFDTTANPNDPNAILSRFIQGLPINGQQPVSGTQPTTPSPFAPSTPSAFPTTSSPQTSYNPDPGTPDPTVPPPTIPTPPQVPNQPPATPPTTGVGPDPTVPNAGNPALGDHPVQTVGNVLVAGLNDAQFRAWLTTQYAPYNKPVDDEGFAYWLGKYHEFGEADPAYFTTRLQQGLSGTTPADAGSRGTPVASPAVDISAAINGANIGATRASAEQDALVQQLIARANQSLVVDRNDPIVRAQTDAFDASQERQLRNFLSGVAETQGPNANITAQTRAANESAAQADAGFIGQVLQSELTARRAEIQNALIEEASVLSAQQQASLQEELAKIDAALAQAQLQQQAFQFDTSQADRLAGL